jgi:hypothetical protein
MTQQNIATQFIAKANLLHAGRYSYDNVVYKNNKTPVDIVCSIHGNYKQTPSNHLLGSGCKWCNPCGQIPSNTLLFIEKARTVHGNKFDYSTTQYQRSNQKVTIICLIHGEFFQTPSKHLEGHGCRQCQYDDKRSDRDIFIVKAHQIHGRYDYSKVLYQSHNKCKVKIVCPDHGMFLQTISNHLTGHGCPFCKTWRLLDLKPSLATSPAILYLLRMDTESESFLKIGKTRRTVEKRYAGRMWDSINITPIHETTSTYSKVSHAEITILSGHKDYAIQPNSILNGRSECFSLGALIPILNSISEIFK